MSEASPKFNLSKWCDTWHLWWVWYERLNDTRKSTQFTNIVGFLRGCSRGGGNWGTLRIPREDWGTLGNILEDYGNHHPPWESNYYMFRQKSLFTPSISRKKPTFFPLQKSADRSSKGWVVRKKPQSVLLSEESWHFMKRFRRLPRKRDSLMIWMVDFYGKCR